jgi:hypothetical protein
MQAAADLCAAAVELLPASVTSNFLNGLVAFESATVLLWSFPNTLLPKKALIDQLGKSPFIQAAVDRLSAPTMVALATIAISSLGKATSHQEQLRQVKQLYKSSFGLLLLIFVSRA